MIVPTVGRIVHLRFRDLNCVPSAFTVHDLDHPCAASIAFPFGDRCVNLSVVDQGGIAHPLTSVRLLQDDDKPHGEAYYAEWMPFQKGQAGATDKAAAIVTDVGAAHRAIEAKGNEIVSYLTGVEERIKGFLAEGHDKLVAAATHVENVVKQAMHVPQPPPENPAPPAPVAGLVAADPSLPVVDGGAPAVAAEPVNPAPTVAEVQVAEKPAEQPQAQPTEPAPQG